MSEQSAPNNGTKMELNKFLDLWMDTNSTLVEKLAKTDTNIINSVWTVEGIWRNIIARIHLAGTSNSVYLGQTLSTTAGKQETTFTLEIPLKKGSGIESEEGNRYPFGVISSTVCYIRMIVKSQYGLTVKEMRAKVRSAILCNVEDAPYLYLDLINTGVGWLNLSQ